MNKYPVLHGLSSRTFKPPPMDGTMTVPEMWDYNMAHSPHHPCYIYDQEDGSLKKITWLQANRAIHRAARIVDSKVHLSKFNSQQKPPVVIILALAGETATKRYIVDTRSPSFC
jgi:hypothetical protein